MNVQAMHLCEHLKKAVLEYGKGENLALLAMLHGFRANHVTGRVYQLEADDSV